MRWMLRIVIGSDHAGFLLKRGLTKYLRQLGHYVVDVGVHGIETVDYPDFAEAVTEILLEGQADRGVLICGNGVGASVAANKVPGIRAGLCHDTFSAHQGVEQDDMNVLVMGGRVVGPELAHDLVQVYLQASFTGEERNRRRLQKINTLEKRYSINAQQPEKRMPRIFPIIRNRYEAVLFDMDGVIADTASIHASCWKTMFDQYLHKWATRNGERFRPFDVASEYKLHVEGKPRSQAVRDFLNSRGIVLPEGTPHDAPYNETVWGLGNLKNELVSDYLSSIGVDAYAGSVVFIKYLRRMDIKTGIVTSSPNCQAVLHAAKVDHLFDVRVDGDIFGDQYPSGKSVPESFFLSAAQRLGVRPERAVVIGITGIRAAVQSGFGLVIGVARKG